MQQTQSPSPQKSSQWLLGLPIAVLGPGSEAVLRNYGIASPEHTVIFPKGPRFDSEALLQVLDKQRLIGQKVLLIKGKNGRDFLAESLKQWGATIDTLSVYERICPRPDEALWQKIESLFEQQRPHTWLFTSSEAVQNLLSMVQQRQWPVLWRSALLTTPCWTPHTRIAETAQALGFQHIRVQNLS